LAIKLESFDYENASEMKLKTVNAKVLIIYNFTPGLKGRFTRNELSRNFKLAPIKSYSFRKKMLEKNKNINIPEDRYINLYRFFFLGSADNEK
jgi:hypothetical protein